MDGVLFLVFLLLPVRSPFFLDFAACCVCLSVGSGSLGASISCVLGKKKEEGILFLFDSRSFVCMTDGRTKKERGRNQPSHHGRKSMSA